MALTDYVPIRSDCWSVCFHGKRLYMGLTGGVDVVEDEKSTRLIRLKGQITCVRVHDQRLFLLHAVNGRWTIREYTLEGEKVHAWGDRDCSRHPNTFIIHEDTIYLPIRCTNSIRRYTLSGKPAVTNITTHVSDTAMLSINLTHAGRILICQNNPSQLVCIDPVTGTEIWRREYLKSPLAVTSDHHNHLLVCAPAQSVDITVEVVREDDGKILSRLEDELIEPQEMDWVFDMAVNDETDVVAVPRLNDGVYLYLLNREARADEEMTE